MIYSLLGDPLSCQTHPLYRIVLISASSLYVEVVVVASKAVIPAQQIERFIAHSHPAQVVAIIGGQAAKGSMIAGNRNGVATADRRLQRDDRLGRVGWRGKQTGCFA